LDVKRLLETALIALIETYGNIGLAAVMIVQTIIAPIPSEALLMFAGAIGMDIFDVLIFGGSGLVIGSVIAFFIARRGGRPVVVKIIGERWTDSVDAWVSKNGTKAILFTRLVPVIPFDLISYVSGVTSIRFRDYFVATVVGAIPRTLFLAYAGSLVGGLLVSLGAGIEIVFIIGIVGLTGILYLEKKGYIGNLENTIIGRVIKKMRK
jgi:uncharacterized membrane protein YdjX (TVP38/TMEM64 family)